MKQTVKLALFAMIVFAVSAVPVFSQEANEAAKNRAENLLVEARAAIGDDTKIQAVKSLSLAGKFITSSSRGESKMEYESDFLFPDKYVKRETHVLEIGSFNDIYGIDGASVWNHQSSTSEFIRFQAMDQKYIDGQKPALRAEAARWLTVMLLRTPGSLPFEVVYAGETDVDGKSADLIDVKGTDGFSARLFLDKTTHRVAMVSYTGKLKGRIGGRATLNADGSVTPEPIQADTVAGMKADEVRVRFLDYRSVDGIQMPYRVVFQSGEGIKEEWEFTKIQLNAPLAPEVFKKKV